MQILVLCGGIAKRLRPVTTSMPKGMIDIEGRPFLEYQVGLFKKNGIKKIVMAVGYLPEQIRKHFGNGKRFGVQIRYSNDGKKLLGTGGAVKKAERFLGENFFVTYGDAYLEVDYKAIYEKFLSSGKEALMTVYKNNNRYDKSNVIYKDGKILLYDKKRAVRGMNYIDYGLLVLSGKALRRIPKNTVYDLARLQKKLVAEDKMASYEVKKRFYEIGTFSGLEEFRKVSERF